MTPTFPIPGLHESKLALKFVHPDPVLGAHLARQQMTMVGVDMLDFIHPNERDRESCSRFAVLVFWIQMTDTDGMRRGESGFRRRHLRK